MPLLAPLLLPSSPPCTSYLLALAPPYSPFPTQLPCVIKRPFSVRWRALSPSPSSPSALLQRKPAVSLWRSGPTAALFKAKPLVGHVGQLESVASRLSCDAEVIAATQKLYNEGILDTCQTRTCAPRLLDDLPSSPDPPSAGDEGRQPGGVKPA